MIAQNYQNVIKKMALASEKYGVSIPELLAVSKKKPASAVAELYAQGQRHFGESYAQEGVEKVEQLQLHNDIVWHFIGPVQSNKTRMIASHFDWVQSVEREKILLRLNQQRPDGLPPLQVLLQMKIGDERSKSGADKNTLLDLLELGSQLEHITIRGLMCIPPPADSQSQQRAYFEQAQQFYHQHQQRFGMDVLSMGMSNDFEMAIACGSTMLRIGTELFGARE
ncbi:YggS family pyridoxal phosphate-dependent enzyme [Marinicella sp. W31]|uniref:YggS family pyridoxal phosphate-dependent enzyme n=1 Tax=Marinicella sp. W31 TaxID=3023713 RepID=UPI0037575DE1